MLCYRVMLAIAIANGNGLAALMTRLCHYLCNGVWNQMLYVQKDLLQIRLVGVSVTRWLDYFSVCGHLQQ